MRRWKLGVPAAVLVAALAAAGTVPRLNAYFQKDFADAAWQQAAVDKVLKGWVPDMRQSPGPGKKTVLIAIVERDGRISGAREHVLSGSASWDRAAIEALRKASPLAPLPKSWPYPRLEVHWHFEATAPK